MIPEMDEFAVWSSGDVESTSNALKTDVTIEPGLDCWTSPALTVSVVQDVVFCGDCCVVLLTGCSGFLKLSNLALWFPAHEERDNGNPGGGLRPLTLVDAGVPMTSSDEKCKRIWSWSNSSFMAQRGSSVWRVNLSPLDACGERSQDVCAVASLVTSLPAGVEGLDCCVSSDGGVFCCMIVKETSSGSSGPLIIRPGQSLLQSPSAKFCTYDGAHGFRAIADAPRLSEGMSVSKGRRRICVWHAWLNEVPEEAERGEFYAINLDQANPATICLTQRAGRVGKSAISDCGTFTLLQANFSSDKPITTHMKLVLVTWPSGEARPSGKRILIEGKHILWFGFLPEFGEFQDFLVTQLEGVQPRTSLWRILSKDAYSAKLLLEVTKPVMSRSVASLVSSGSKPPHSRTVVFGTEEANTLPSLSVLSLGSESSSSTAEPQTFPLPQPDGAADLQVEKVIYDHRGAEVTALLMERVSPPCPFDAPLLVNAHGGPAIGVVHSQRMASDQTRYPLRHFLVAGYRVFLPLFRGTLGFGDNWAQGNIGSQGSLKGDLGDILAGLDFLQNRHPKLAGTIDPSRTAIFGGSYGGYMTVRAMVEQPHRFAAGVALYGFVHNRWMTYEGGDFTWEDEYLVAPPADEEATEDVGFELTIEEHCHEVAVEAKKAPSPDASPSAGASSSPAVSPGDGASSLRSRVGSETSLCSASPSDIWPLPREMEASDTFNGLHRICKPLLLMHGEKDDICPLSQSQVVFHMLEKRKVPTGLIVYPGEGHGFDEPQHQQDRDRRMLAWWQEHLPAACGGAATLDS